MHGPTFMANPLACAVALASTGLLADGAWREDVARIERGLDGGTGRGTRPPGVSDVRVLGAIGVVELVGPVDVAAATRAAVERGVWLRPFRNLVYTMPPYVTDDDDLAGIAAGRRGGRRGREPALRCPPRRRPMWRLPWRPSAERALPRAARDRDRSGPAGPSSMAARCSFCARTIIWALPAIPAVRAAAAEAAERWGAGAGASPLVSGHMAIHRELEEELAEFKGLRRVRAVRLRASWPTSASSRRSPDAGDVILSDALNHASLIEGCRLSRAETIVYEHCDLGLARGRPAIAPPGAGR